MLFFFPLPSRVAEQLQDCGRAGAEAALPGIGRPVQLLLFKQQMPPREPADTRRLCTSPDTICPAKSIYASDQTLPCIYSACE